MSQYPSSIDDNSSLPIVTQDVTEQGADAINAAHDAILAIEETLGLNPQGNVTDVATRIGGVIDVNGNLQSSALSGLGLVTLPITDAQVSPSAAIAESKIALTYPTTVLQSNISSLQSNLTGVNNWITINGNRVVAHLTLTHGTTARHYASNIDADLYANTPYLSSANIPLNLSLTDLNTFLSEINNLLNMHQFADGTAANGLPSTYTPFVGNIKAFGGGTFSNAYAHTASGVYVNTDGFISITNTNPDLQSVLNFVDTQNYLVTGSKFQNFNSPGISRKTRSTNLEIPSVATSGSDGTLSVTGSGANVVATLTSPTLSTTLITPGTTSIVISGASLPANNGTFSILSTVTNSVSYSNPYAAAGSVSWSISTNNPYYGYNDIVLHLVSGSAVVTNLSTSGPVDDYQTGDDVVVIKPSVSEVYPFQIDAEFANVRPGMACIVTYSTSISQSGVATTTTSVSIRALIREIRVESGTPNNYYIRLDKKNYAATGTTVSGGVTTTVVASVFICRINYSMNKSGVLGLSAVNVGASIQPSLLVNNPSGAFVLGQDFNASLLDDSHYMLYLAFYPVWGSTEHHIVAVDVTASPDGTGALGTTPGLYTQDGIVNNINYALRQKGVNSRFVAYKYEREIGIMLMDSYDGASFSIVGGVVDTTGIYNKATSQSTYPNNVVDLFGSTTVSEGQDAFGFGPRGANVACPAPGVVFSNAAAAFAAPVHIIAPHHKNYYYPNLTETENLYGYGSNQTLVVPTVLTSGSFWDAVVMSQTYIGGVFRTTYRVFADLDEANLQVGKTMVVLGRPKFGTTTNYNANNFGRFVISNILENCTGQNYTDIQVYDASVNYFGETPKASLGSSAVDLDFYSPPGGNNQVAPGGTGVNDAYTVRLYFSADSIGFNKENLEDSSIETPFERYFEAYVDQSGKSFVQERARKILPSGTETYRTINGTTFATFPNADYISIMSVSKKLTGFVRGTSNVITLVITSYSGGIYTGFLCSYVYGTPGTMTRKGPVTSGKVGVISRFYNDTFEDYIDFLLPLNHAGLSITYTGGFAPVDIELFPSFQDNQELVYVGSCDYLDNTKVIQNVQDGRSFGVVSQEDFNKDALDYIAQYEAYTHCNGIIRGFDIDMDVSPVGGGTSALTELRIKGGVVAIDGKIIVVNDQVISPKTLTATSPSLSYVPYWVCVNTTGEIVLVSNAGVSGLVSVTYTGTGTTFNTLSQTLPDMIARKDLVLLYEITGTSGSLPYFTYSDFRRYTTNVDNMMHFKLSDTIGNGNFYTFDSVMNWIGNGRSVTSTVVVDGSISYGGPVVFNSGLGNTEFVFDGEGTGSLTLSSTTAIQVYSNVNITFKNMTLNLACPFESSIYVFDGYSSSLTFENCTINLTAGHLLATGSIANVDFVMRDCVVVANSLTTDAIVTGKGRIVIENNTITGTCSSSTVLPKFIYLNKTFEQQGTDNISIKGNTFLSSGGVGNIYFCGITLPTNSDVYNIDISDNTFATSADATGKNSYNSDIVNVSEQSQLNSLLDAMVVINTSGNIYGLSISRNKFVWNSNNLASNRFPFIMVRLNPTNSSSISTQAIVLNIDGNRFNSIGYSASSPETLWDHKAAIVVACPNTGTALVDGALPTFSTLSGSISDNRCFQRQSILVSHIENSASDLFASTLNNRLLTPAGLTIARNTAGAIGTLLAASFPVVSQYGTDIGASSGAMNHVPSKVSIEGNNCLWITHLTASGRFVYPYNVDILSGAAGTYDIGSSTLSDTVLGSFSAAQTAVNNLTTLLNHASPTSGDLPAYLVTLNMTRLHQTGKTYSTFHQVFPINGSALTYNAGTGSIQIYLSSDNAAGALAGLGSNNGTSIVWSMSYTIDPLNFDLAPIEVRGNTCSWIHLIASTDHFITTDGTNSAAVLRSNAAAPVISDNQLSAYDYGFLSHFPCQRWYVDTTGSTFYSAYPSATSGHPTYPSIKYFKGQTPSFLFGCSQAFAISVYSNQGKGVSITNGEIDQTTPNSPVLYPSSSSAVISNNVISSNLFDDSYNHVNASFRYGYDYRASTIVGGGFIYSQVKSIITNNQCFDFYGSLSTMRVGLITVGDSSVVSGNRIGRTGNVWNYVMVMPLWDKFTNPEFLTERYTTVYFNSFQNAAALSGSGLLTGGLHYFDPGMIVNNWFDSPHTNSGWTDAYQVGQTGAYSDASVVADVGNGNVTSSTNWSVFTTSYIPDDWVVKDNKNQMDVTVLALNDGQFSPTGIIEEDDANLISAITNNYGSFNAVTGMLQITSQPTDLTGAIFAQNICLTKTIPSGAKFVKAVVGTILTTGGASSAIPANQVRLSLRLSHAPDSFLAQYWSKFDYTAASTGNSPYIFQTNINGLITDYRNNYDYSYVPGDVQTSTISFPNPTCKLFTIADSTATTPLNSVVKSDHSYVKDSYLSIYIDVKANPFAYSITLSVSPVYIYWTY